MILNKKDNEFDLAIGETLVHVEVVPSMLITDSYASSEFGIFLGGKPSDEPHCVARASKNERFHLMVLAHELGHMLCDVEPRDDDDLVKEIKDVFQSETSAWQRASEIWPGAFFGQEKLILALIHDRAKSFLRTFPSLRLEILEQESKAENDLKGIIPRHGSLELPMDIIETLREIRGGL